MSVLAEPDQAPSQHYSIWEAGTGGDRPGLFDNLTTESSLQCTPVTSKAAVPPKQSFLGGMYLDQPQRPPSNFTSTRILPQRSSSVVFHLAQARATLADLVRSQHRAERDSKHQEALCWLSENRQKYAGQWIALQGARLLATGKTARDVYSRVLEECPPPLVIKIDAEELPFGGW